jgi:CRISPR-associated protein Cas1
MAHVYITSSDVSLGIAQGRLSVRKSAGGTPHEMPLSNVDSINLYGNPHVSTQLVKECLKEGIPVGYYSEDGHYVGRIAPFGSVDPFRQKQQILLIDDEEFKLGISQAIIAAKIENSRNLLESLSSVHEFADSDMNGIRHSEAFLSTADTVDRVLGFEGNAAKNYFSCLSRLVTDERFKFSGRSANPPKDAANSMLSYGYSLLYRSIVGAIDRHGLHPYFGFMHKLHRGHAALASDLIEELRAPFVDRIVLETIHSGAVSPDDFYQGQDGGIYMDRTAMKGVTNRICEGMDEKRPYFSNYGDSHSYAFQTMLDRKIESLVHAIEAHDFEMYMPVHWSPER